MNKFEHDENTFNILVIEDNDEKRTRIINALQEIYQDQYPMFYTTKCINESKWFIRNQLDRINLIILDWIFPRYEIGELISNAGREILNYLNHLSNTKDIIIISSELIDMDNELNKKLCDFVIGNIEYESFTNIKEEINSVLNKDDNKKLIKRIKR